MDPVAVDGGGVYRHVGLQLEGDCVGGLDEKIFWICSFNIGPNFNRPSWSKVRPPKTFVWGEKTINPF